MTRSVWKGPFVHQFTEKVDKLKKNRIKNQLKPGQEILQLFQILWGTVYIHNGKSFIPITISEEMVG